MLMRIERAVDWNKISILLESELNTIGYNPDLHKMFHNIGHMVTELSKLEVSFRRTQKYSMLNENVEKINVAIKQLQNLLLIARLMK
jgi:hypothetical protein